MACIRPMPCTPKIYAWGWEPKGIKPKIVGYEPQLKTGETNPKS